MIAVKPFVQLLSTAALHCMWSTMPVWSILYTALIITTAQRKGNRICVIQLYSAWNAWLWSSRTKKCFILFWWSFPESLHLPKLDKPFFLVKQCQQSWWNWIFQHQLVHEAEFWAAGRPFYEADNPSKTAGLSLCCCSTKSCSCTDFQKFCMCIHFFMHIFYGVCLFVRQPWHWTYYVTGKNNNQEII